MDIAGRADKVRAGFPEAEVDALLVTDLTNVRYLTGFTGSAGRVLMTGDALLLVTDGRYEVQASDEVERAGVTARVEIAGTVADQDQILVDAVGEVAHLGLEAKAVSWAAWKRYSELAWSSASLVPTENMVEKAREVKDDGEIARLQRAAAIADQALANVVGMLGERPSEAAFAWALDSEMHTLGADGVSFETIVASGPNGAKPHHRPADRTIAQGDLVVIDFGALVDGYHSDMTRTFIVGDADETQSRMLDVVRRAQAAGVAATRSGVDASAVDAECRAVIDDAGWGDAFNHGTGHGVGLVIHEDPRVSRVSTTKLAAGHVVTVEPGVYLPEHGGVRIEDTLLVTDDGSVTLTLAPKDPSPPALQPN
jgi:Xaa-Pro aminopeptidase